MVRRYPEYTSLYQISALMGCSFLSTFGLYYAGPRNWGPSQRFLLASGGFFLIGYSCDILLDYIKHEYNKKIEDLTN